MAWDEYYKIYIESTDKYIEQLRKEIRQYIEEHELRVQKAEDKKNYPLFFWKETCSG